jgi:hypothetical protein
MIKPISSRYAADLNLTVATAPTCIRTQTFAALLPGCIPIRSATNAFAKMTRNWFES